jgi:hypothetical protein
MPKKFTRQSTRHGNQHTAPGSPHGAPGLQIEQRERPDKRKAQSLAAGEFDLLRATGGLDPFDEFPDSLTDHLAGVVSGVVRRPMAERSRFLL